MRIRHLNVIFAFILVPIAAFGQSRNTSALDGLWDGARNTQDLVQLMKADGQPIPFTDRGLQSQRSIDYAKNPNGFCLPPGPSRAITGPSPFQIVQSPDIICQENEKDSQKLKSTPKTAARGSRP
jgi:hypothetical protein